MRYQVARTSPDDVHEVLTRVADVEGLFAQPRLPARRQLVLHDGPEVTGDFVIEVLDDRRPMRWWDVVDPVVRDGVVTGFGLSAGGTSVRSGAAGATAVPDLPGRPVPRLVP